MAELSDDERRRAETPDQVMQRMIEMVESPAEEAFVRGWFAWCAAAQYTPIRYRDPGYFGFRDAPYSNPDGKTVFSVVPQCDVDRYRLDFLIVPRIGEKRAWAGYAIEIDGHRWHERTHADAAAQRRRDRFLMQRHRILTLRFAAIEVFNDAISVARETADSVLGLFEEDLRFAAHGDYRAAPF